MPNLNPPSFSLKPFFLDLAPETLVKCLCFCYKWLLLYGGSFLKKKLLPSYVYNSVIVLIVLSMKK